jgi:hypothetical protein
LLIDHRLRDKMFYFESEVTGDHSSESFFNDVERIKMRLAAVRLKISGKTRG